MKTTLAGVGLALLVAVTPASAAGACACSDKVDLLNMLVEADAAIPAYEAQIVKMLTKEGQSGEPLLMTPETYDENLQAAIAEVQLRVTNPAARKARARTWDDTCQTENNAETACLKEVVDKHERIHRDACLAAKASGAGKKRLVDIANEEIKAYGVTRDTILSILKGLPCKPSGWFGIVTYAVGKEWFAEKTIGPSSTEFQKTTGGSETINDLTGFKGTIWVVDDVPSARQGLYYRYQRDYNVQGQVLCSRIKGMQATSSTATDTRSADDDLTRKPDFGVSVDKPTRGAGVVTFRALTHNTEMTITHSASTSGSCNDQPPSKPPPSKVKQSFGVTDSIKVPGVLSPDGMSLIGGTRTPLVPTENTQEKNVKTSHTVRLEVRFSLHRMPPK